MKDPFEHIKSKGMKGLYTIWILLLSGMTTVFGQPVPDWENPGIFERNQVAPHATLIPFNNLEQALENNRRESPNYLSLNGIWDFSWAINPGEVQPGVYPDIIRVPSNWQMEGFGYPIFRNIGYNFKPDPPFVPEDFNPVGTYYRTFEIPADWSGKRIFLHFEGVQSASYVWINGIETGYNQGANEPAEYDITEYLVPDVNNITVKVLRFCDGSYLEDQDTWRLSGIYRDVYLMATPQVHIRDYYVTTDLDKDYLGADLKFEVNIHNHQKEKAVNHSVQIELYDRKNILVAGPLNIPVGVLEADADQTLDSTIHITNPDLWSAEHPNLYTLLFKHYNDKGNLVEIISNKTGFREIEIRNRAILVNGVPVKFNGVNSHMLHPETGHCIDRETLRKDLVLMKKFNINCVRTSHYPPNVDYLDIADSLGMYIFDETGDEAHWSEHLSGNPHWKDQYLDRMKKMVYRDRNHPAVIVWSAGNESGWGENLCDLIAEGKKIDPSRPGWMYGGNFDTDPHTNPIACEDIVGPRYLKPDMLRERFAKSGDTRPSFMDEYISAAGNSLGGLDDYWELIHQYPGLTGGAIWDWVSPGLTMTWRTIEDESPHQIESALMSKAHLVEGKFGNAVYLSGYDDWVEIYRDPALDMTGDSLTISFWIKPEKYNGNGYFLTKGDYEYGIIQADEEHIDFYIQTHQKRTLRVKVPAGWEQQWHHVMGTYDGSSLRLYINNELTGQTTCNGNIKAGPYPVNIGRSANLWDIHMSTLCHATIDRVRIFDSVVSVDELENETPALKSRSKLWLDFEKCRDESSFYALGMGGRPYGLVWPDRQVQPELWQLKKAGQPVAIGAVDLQNGEFEFINRFAFTNLKDLDITWELTEDHRLLQTGKLSIDLPPRDTSLIKIPFSKPKIKPGAHYQVLFSAKLARSSNWTETGHEVAWEQFEMPFYREPRAIKERRTSITVKKEIEELIIEGESFRYRISRTDGSVTSMQYLGRELLEKGPAFNVWRAPLSNEMDYWTTFSTNIGQTSDGMGNQIANGWYTTGLNRLVHELYHLSFETTDNSVKIISEAVISSNNYTTSFDVVYTYTIDNRGNIKVHTRVEPEGHMTHWLPKVGLQLKLKADLRNISWYGRGPFETYPDRKTGAKTGRYQTTVDEDEVPYLVPQDYGNKTDVHWVTITDEEGVGLKFHSDQPFNTSIQKYSTDRLTRAGFRNQLKEDSAVTLNLDYRVSGVGGTAISVINKYRVLPADYAFTFFIKPFKLNDDDR
ncbi:MAG: DUF4981 domain-containing protein [Bacteroidales bacterium]|nr:DUF4981 domain-containing protein [Bacteroidales bacterium]